ncbi:MAG: hypothetical protein KDC95_08310 [Planctomycetes bacterium]|nr:hypothetical protein [Planctomycetota bacterium]
MRTLWMLGAAVAVLPSIAVAQTTETLPDSPTLGTTEGDASRHVPLRYAPARIQCGYSGSGTSWTTGKVITQLSARANGGAYLTTGFSCDIQVWLSSGGTTKSCDPKVLSNKFADNHGDDVAVFQTKKTFNFAAFAAYTGVAPFNIVLGDRPFAVKGDAVVIDWATYASANQANVNFYVDSQDDRAVTGTRGTSVSYGTPCNPTNFYNYSTGYNVGETFRTYSYTRNTGDVSLMWISDKRVDQAIGGGCSIYADLASPAVFIHPIPVVTPSGGYANFVWGTVPAALKGQQVWSQGVAFDPTNALRWSRGIETTFGDYRNAAPYDCGHRYNYGSGTRTFDPDKDDAAYGWEGQTIVFKVN